MIEFLVSFCTSLLLCQVYILFLERKKGRQHDKRLLLAQAMEEFKFSRARRMHNLSVLRTTAHPDALFIEISQRIRTCTPVKTGPQSYPSRQAYLRRCLVIARQSYRALPLGLPSLILGYARYLHRRQR